MSGFVAAAWPAANETYYRTEFIVFAQNGCNANSYYRIIPEIQGSGFSYESVDVCDGMGDLLLERT
jgi:hypothetical protein